MEAGQLKVQVGEVTVIVTLAGPLTIPGQPRASVILSKVYVYTPATALDCITVAVFDPPVLETVWGAPPFTE